MRAGRPVADDDAGKIDREEPRPVRNLRGAEDHQRRGGDERRVQALRQRDAIERQYHQPAADETDDGTENGLAKEFEADMQGRALADRNQLDQHQGQEHRERIVGAGFNFKGGADARPQPQPLGVNQQEHRGGVGGSEHGARQQRFGPVQVERIFGHRRGDQRGEQHAESGEHDRRRQHRPDGLKSRPQPAVEQDQRQRNRADQIGGSDVVELQAAGAGVAGNHAYHEEHQQQRRTEAQRQQARHDSCHHQARAEKNGYADRIE